jgi:hypothetical protein
MGLLLIDYMTEFHKLQYEIKSQGSKILGEQKMPSEQETLAGGIKHDESKRRMDLVPTSLISSVARILEFGARKYGDNNWREGLKWSRVYAALQRHLADFWDGNDLDSESGLPHLYHAACNIAFLIEFYEKRKDLDDRYSTTKPKLPF